MDRSVLRVRWVRLDLWVLRSPLVPSVRWDHLGLWDRSGLESWNLADLWGRSVLLVLLGHQHQPVRSDLSPPLRLPVPSALSVLHCPLVLLGLLAQSVLRPDLWVQ